MKTHDYLIDTLVEMGLVKEWDLERLESLRKEKAMAEERRLIARGEARHNHLPLKLMKRDKGPGPAGWSRSSA